MEKIFFFLICSAKRDYSHRFIGPHCRDHKYDIAIIINTHMHMPNLAAFFERVICRKWFRVYRKKNFF